MIMPRAMAMIRKGQVHNIDRQDMQAQATFVPASSRSPPQKSHFLHHLRFAPEFATKPMTMISAFNQHHPSASFIGRPAR
jgi:hypothetical protein